MRNCALVLAASAVMVSLHARADGLERDEEESSYVQTALIEAGIVFGISAIGHWRIRLRRPAYRLRRVGVAIAAEGSIRHGSWNDLDRTTYDHVLEALGHLAW